jgi:hypothetical protein
VTGSASRATADSATTSSKKLTAGSARASGASPSHGPQGQARASRDLINMTSSLVAEADGNRTRRRRGAPPTGFEDRRRLSPHLSEAKPAPVRLKDLERTIAARGKRVAGGLSVDLNTLKVNKEVLNPSWGYWTVP